MEQDAPLASRKADVIPTMQSSGEKCNAASLIYLDNPELFPYIPNSPFPPSPDGIAPAIPCANGRLPNISKGVQDFDLGESRLEGEGANDMLEEQKENEALRQAVSALLRAVENASIPDTPEISAAIREARRGLEGNASEAATAGSPTQIRPASHGNETVIFPTMMINHEKVRRNRLYRSEMSTRIILVTLLWNQNVRVDKDDLLASFASQDFDILPATLLSRLSKMRSDGLIAQRQRGDDRLGAGKYAESAGVYRLTEMGLAAARVEANRTNALPPTQLATSP